MQNKREEQEDMNTQQKIKVLFPDGKKSAYIFRIPSQVYNSTNGQKHSSWFRRILHLWKNIKKQS